MGTAICPHGGRRPGQFGLRIEMPARKRVRVSADPPKSKRRWRSVKLGRPWRSFAGRYTRQYRLERSASPASAGFGGIRTQSRGPPCPTLPPYRLHHNRPDGDGRNNGPATTWGHPRLVGKEKRGKRGQLVGQALGGGGNGNCPRESAVSPSGRKPMARGRGAKYSQTGIVRREHDAGCRAALQSERQHGGSNGGRVDWFGRSQTM
jgi:hypothetical protein